MRLKRRKRYDLTYNPHSLVSAVYFWDRCLHFIWSYVPRLHTCDQVKWQLANNVEVSEWTFFCKNVSMLLTPAWLVYNFTVITWDWREERGRTLLNLISCFSHFYSKALTFYVISLSIEGKYANLYSISYRLLTRPSYFL